MHLRPPLSDSIDATLYWLCNYAKSKNNIGCRYVFVSIHRLIPSEAANKGRNIIYKPNKGRNIIYKPNKGRNIIYKPNKRQIVTCILDLAL